MPLQFLRSQSFYPADSPTIRSQNFFFHLNGTDKVVTTLRKQHEMLQFRLVSNGILGNILSNKWETTNATGGGPTTVGARKLIAVLVVEDLRIEDHVQLGGNLASPPLLRPVRGNTGLKITAGSQRLGAQ